MKLRDKDVPLETRLVQVRGQVQGVGYREACVRRARKLGVTGWVRNRMDGTVEAVFEGPEHAVAQCVAWCRMGPPRADVAGVEVVEEPAEGLEGFRVR